MATLDETDFDHLSATKFHQWQRYISERHFSTALNLEKPKTKAVYSTVIETVEGDLRDRLEPTDEVERAELKRTQGQLSRWFPML